MPHSLYKPEPKPDEQVVALEREIALLEKELAKAEGELNAFTAQIRNSLHFQIGRIRELTSLYKKQKLEKKAKRLEQKKKGKNYREPEGLLKSQTVPFEGQKPGPEKQEELKRLYKEAIRQVHPDKFVNEEEHKSGKATELTIKLNDIYQSGDLEELKGFHEHILSGNAMSHVPYQPETISDVNALLAFLQKQKSDLAEALTETKRSELFHILKTYENPLTFIPELRLQFEQKITQLEKRTRTKKGK
jgi:hypothetical protein